MKIAASKEFKEAGDDDAKAKAATQKLADLQKAIEADSFVGNAAQSDVDGALSKYQTEIADHFSKEDFFVKLSGGKVDFALLARLAIIAVFKSNFTTLTGSGIVVAGFGEKDYFPSLFAYRCFGLVLGKLIWAEDPNKKQKIDQANSSAIVPFAQDEMIETFIFGMNSSSIDFLQEQFVNSLNGFHAEIVKAGICHDVTTDAAKLKLFNETLERTKEGFSDTVFNHLFNTHSIPLRRVLGMLPFDELAELAETLILIESLKERVTRPSASVGGPIDVAVISKNDGFIWIKRKHYFDAKLNPRFFARRGLQPNG